MAEFTGRPAYLQIADAVREQIVSGALEPGQRLPTESALMEDFGVSRTVAKMAIATLRNEGLVTSHQGKGSFVRERRPVRRIASERYQREIDQIRTSGQDALPPETSFTRDQNIVWQDYRLDVTFEETPAAADVAELLDIPVTTPVLARRFVFYAADRAEQISRSYLPLHLVAGTPVADPANEPWPGGNIAQLATLGVIVSRVRETVRSRMPTTEETETLRIPRGVPVLTITRVMLTGPDRDRPVEAAVDIVIPGDRVALDYVIDLNPPAGGFNGHTAGDE